MRYYIADCHFYHASLNTQMDMRGFSGEEEMNEYMIERWNRKVGPRDEVVILGDFSLGNAENTAALLERLHGRLFLVAGNHDLFGKNKKYETDRFEWVRSYAEIRDNKRKVILCHYPILNYNGQYLQHSDGTPVTYMLHGHVHDTLDARLIEQFCEQTGRTEKQMANGNTVRIPCHLINCFCKYSDYTPLSLDEWIILTEKRLKNLKGVTP